MPAPVDTSHEATLGRRENELAIARADRKIEEGGCGAALPAAAITADHEPAAGRTEAVDLAMRHLENMEVDLTEQRGRLPVATGVPALDQPEQRRPADLEQPWILKVRMTARDEVVGTDHREAHGVLMAIAIRLAPPSRTTKRPVWVAAYSAPSRGLMPRSWI
jgi:hypothetical protein